MPIRPIEIMKSHEASQIKYNETSKNQHTQVQSDISFHNIVREESTRPVQTMKSENKEFRYDAKEKGSNKYFGSQNRQKSREEEQDKNKPEAAVNKRPGGIDILI
jgi:hypothetical protein